MNPTWIRLRPSAASFCTNRYDDRDVGGQRLLAQHRHAAIQAGGHLLEVRAPRGGQQHGVDLGVVDRRDRVGHHPGADSAADLGAFSATKSLTTVTVAPLIAR